MSEKCKNNQQIIMSYLREIRLSGGLGDLTNAPVRAIIRAAET